MRDSGKFPTDHELRNQFKVSDFYLSYQFCAFGTYLFEKLENQDNVEKVSTYDTR